MIASSVGAVRGVLISLLTVGWPALSVAAPADMPGFAAVCDDKSGRALRSDRAAHEKAITSEWSDNETFPIKPFLRISYQAGANFALDLQTRRQLPVVAEANATMIILDANSNGGSVSAWSYAINLETDQIVATQANAFNAFGAGIKGRVVELSCKFSR